MTRDLDDPYAFEKKPLHYIPGYTGHLPLNRERFGINYREASADTIAMQKKKGKHNPVVPLDRPTPNHFKLQPGGSAPKPLNRSQKFVPADEVAQEEATEDQLSHLYPHAQGPYGVYPDDTWVAKLDYVTTSSKVAPNNIPDDIAALDPRLKILQSRTEYRSDSSATMQTSSEELFDMRDDGAVYGGGAALQ